MKRPHTEKIVFDGPAGALEGLLEAPPVPLGVAVVCHPHPLYQGTMTNKVAHTLARSFIDINFASLRFNFRGVGASEGSYDEARGETDDALAVADFAARRWPGLPLWYAGFSFGAFVALRAANARLPSGLVTVAIPVQRFDVESLRQPDCPWIVVQGDQDELVDVDAVVSWIDGLSPGPELLVMNGVDHFFHGRLTDLRDNVVELLQPLVGSAVSA